MSRLPLLFVSLPLLLTACDVDGGAGDDVGDPDAGSLDAPNPTPRPRFRIRR